MDEKRATLEIIAPTVDEALTKGLAELGLNEDDVAVEVLDEGSKGLLGLRSRQARIRLTVGAGEDLPKPSASPQPSYSDGDENNTLAIAQATVSELLEKLQVNAEVEAEINEGTQAENSPHILVNIKGNDLSILIGRRAETLNALQYITRLIVGKEVGRSAYITVDVEGYRSRREDSLRKLANRMANQAVTSGRRQMLEPMSPFERRIIHIELTDNSEVSTESVGDEPRRKVTIIPK